jgi:hypothetical protein
MLKIKISEWNSTPSKMSLGKLIIELMGGYSCLVNLVHLLPVFLLFKRNPMGANSTIGTFLPNISKILANQTSEPSCLP